MMIKNFNQWNDSRSFSHINEDRSKIISKTAEFLINQIAKAAKTTPDDLIKGGFKGIRGGVVKKLMNVSQEEISKLEKGLSEIVEIRKTPWWGSIAKDSRKALEKEGDEIAANYMLGYHNGDEAIIKAARNSSKKYMKKVKDIETIQKEKDKLVSFVDDQVPGRKMKDSLNSKLDDAQKEIDDALRSGDPERLERARKYVDDVKGYVRDAGKQAEYTKYSTPYRRGGGLFGRGVEDGANIAEDTANALKEEGKEGLLKRIKRAIFDNGKQNVKDIANKSKDGGGTSLWSMFKKGLKWLIIGAATAYGGTLAWNYMKNGNQTKGVETIEKTADEMEQKFGEEGLKSSEIDANKASFAETFKIIFAGSDEDLPIEDSQDLKTMMNSNSTITEFLSRAYQLCFEYPKKYYTENIDKFHSSSKFYGFMKELNQKIGVPKMISAISDADGMVSKSLEETFFDNGSPVSLGDYGYAGYSNPNMKILFGPNEPARMDQLVEESKDFLSMMSMFKRKIMNDSIEAKVSDSLKINGKMTEEEFEARSSRIEEELGEQLSKKEESFVAMTGMVLSYNAESEPFSYFYGFDPENLYETVDQINSLTEESFDLRSNGQLSRIYETLNYEFSEVYKELGKERTLYGVMEYSKMGVIMRCIMALYGLEEICRIIVSEAERGYEDSFTKTEVEEYQKVLKQIQNTEGTKQTVVISGELDDETQAAIKEYQKKLGLPETGKPGEKSLKAMKDYLVSILTSKT